MKDDKILESELNQNVDVGTAEDVEAVMKKYDRESNTRVWEGKPGVIVRWCSILFSLYSIYVTLFSTALPEVRLTIFLGTILILGYLNYPIKKGVTRANYLPGTTLSLWLPVHCRFSTSPGMHRTSLKWQPASPEIRLWSLSQLLRCYL